jgi:hypothetical protein
VIKRLKSNLQEALALPLSVVLTINHQPEIRIVVVEVRAAEYYPIQDIEVFNLQLELDALTERKVFGQSYVLV